MKNTDLSVELVDPRNLSEDDISEIHEAMQDVWAEGIGEYVQCDRCQRVYSKKDIHGSLPSHIYARTVKSIA
jgi:hypothetical protein